MGRPLNKKYFGTPAGTELGITLTAFIPAAGTLGYISGTGGSSAVSSTIISQKGSRKYVVSNAQGEGKVTLANNPVPLQGEAYLVGYDGMTAVALKKLTARLAVDWNNVRYSWYLENDSTTDIIRLTAI